MTERRENNIKCFEDIAVIKECVSTIKDDIQENKILLNTQEHELVEHVKQGCPESSHIKEQNGIITELRLDFVSLRSAIMMTNKILIGAGIIAGIVFGLLRFIG